MFRQVATDETKPFHGEPIRARLGVRNGFDLGRQGYAYNDEQGHVYVTTGEFNMEQRLAVPQRWRRHRIFNGPVEFQRLQRVDFLDEWMDYSGCGYPGLYDIDVRGGGRLERHFPLKRRRCPSLHPSCSDDRRYQQLSTLTIEDVLLMEGADGALCWTNRDSTSAA